MLDRQKYDILAVHSLSSCKKVHQSHAGMADNMAAQCEAYNGCLTGNETILHAECRMAAERSDVPFLLLDVELSSTNRALAMEKALTKPASQRRTAKPILRGGQNLPCNAACLCCQCLGLSTGDGCH